MPDLRAPLRRTRHDRMIGGVCGGLARYLGIDATLTRVIYVLVSLISTGFPGALAYIVLWLVIPEED